MLAFVTNVVKVSMMGAAISLKNAKHHLPHVNVNTDKIKEHVPHVDKDKIKDRVKSIDINTDKIKDRVDDLDIDTDKVLDIGQKVAAITGHEEVALVLTIVKEFTQGNNGAIAETLVAELLSDHLTEDQIKDL